MEVERSVELDNAHVAATEVDGPVAVALVLERVPEGVVATGSVDFDWTGTCRRCLEDVGGHIRVDVREVFSARELDEETYPFADEQVDLEPVVREAVLPALPLAPLCREDCAGPDPERFPAGRPAEQAEPAKDPRWAALDDLDVD